MVVYRLVFTIKVSSTLSFYYTIYLSFYVKLEEHQRLIINFHVILIT